MPARPRAATPPYPPTHFTTTATVRVTRIAGAPTVKSRDTPPASHDTHPSTMNRSTALLLILTAFAAPLSAQDLPPTLPDLPFHLTARPWKPLATPRDAYLDAIEGLCRFTAKHQDAKGAVIDPFLKREHQYATPYFAF